MNQTESRKSFLQRYQDVMPTGAGTLFLIQIFATLGFSVLYSTLILYATRGLQLDDMLATSITGSFIALNYFLHLLGGYVGGRLLSNRSLFGIGMICQVIGLGLISVPDSSHLLWGLATFLAGSGINMTCINCMVTQLFEPHDKRREAAFLWNYSGMNIGFFIGFTISGYFQLTQGYHQLFLLSGFGNLLSLVILMYNWKILKDRNTTFVDAPAKAKQQRRLLGIGIVIALVFILRSLLEHTEFCNEMILVIGATMLAVLIALTLKQDTPEQQNKMWAYIILAISSFIFWTLYQLAPMGLNLFVERNVDRHFLGYLIAPQWIYNINTLVIIFGGPLLSVIFSYLRERGIKIKLALQFSIAIICIGMAYVILPIGIKLANAAGYVNFHWILLSYVLQSLGELFLSPIGYAMIGELAPQSLRGLLMGTWMMISGVAAIVSDHFSKVALGDTSSIDPLMTNQSYSHTFGMLGLTAIAIGVLLSLFIPQISKLTNERNSRRQRATNLEINEQVMTESI